MANKLQAVTSKRQAERKAKGTQSIEASANDAAKAAALAAHGESTVRASMLDAARADAKNRKTHDAACIEYARYFEPGANLGKHAPVAGYGAAMWRVSGKYEDMSKCIAALLAPIYGTNPRDARALNTLVKRVKVMRDRGCDLLGATRSKGNGNGKTPATPVQAALNTIRRALNGMSPADKAKVFAALDDLMSAYKEHRNRPLGKDLKPLKVKVKVKAKAKGKGKGNKRAARKRAARKRAA